MLIEEHKLLGPFTTLGIGGPARWFIEARTEDDVAEASEWASKHPMRLFVLGGGSNLVVADAGFDGLAIHIGLRGIRCEAQDAFGLRTYRVAAGEDWDGFVERAVREGCAGIECLAGIPGTVGGTPVQNVGAYGQEVSSTIERVRAFDLDERRFVEFAGDECGFAYRRSRFNSTERGRYVVTRVDYQLAPGGAPSLRYADVQRSFAEKENPTLAEVAAAVRRIRQAKGMLLVDGDPDCRSAGSFFKNPVVSEEQVRHIAERGAKEPPRFPAGADAGSADRVKVPAAWLIEQSGFAKGYRQGSAGISSRHTLALINRGGATATEILTLAEKIKGVVRDRFGITLEMEPVLLGF
ncbi:MAG TPA: UDP-N-acetylmuramate dehydrogenase [Terracidiphilus sp.]|jgi:UDP-N-acetylmuramate dehydrogenase